MSQKLIKVVNPDVAKKIAATGFSYITEQIGNQKMFVFAQSDGLMKLLCSGFKKNDFVFDNKLRF